MISRIKKILLLEFKEEWEQRLSDFGWLFFRLSISLLMLSHGFGKLMNFSQIAPNFFDFLSLGGTISLSLVVLSEFFGSLCVLFGFLTRWASSSIVFTMLVAAFVAHGADPFQKKELAILYALAFCLPLFFGGGKYSFDSYLKKKLF